MKKHTIYLISFLSILIGFFFFWNVAIKFFFNDYLYETPNLKGLTIEEATKLIGKDFKLTNMGKFYSEVEEGKIYSQLPPTTKHIKKGRPIKVWVSKGLDTVLVPNLRGKNLQDARAILSDSGIKIGNIVYTTERTINNQIIGSNPKEYTSISKEKPISLLVNVSKIKSIKMPDILGYSLDEGINVLRKENLVLGEVSRIYREDFPNNTIIDTNHPIGKSVSTGSIINITITVNNKEE